MNTELDIDLDLQTVLLTPQQLDEITTRMATQITADYKEGAFGSRPLVMICVLKGAVMFYTDLVRKMERPVELEFVKVTSYGAGTVSSGQLKMHLDLFRTDYRNLNILLVEDITDSGRTLSKLTQLFRDRGAHSVRCCTLLDKPDRREVDFTPDYIGAVIPDEFVVGYGLDYNERYRDLPYIGILRPEIYS